MAKPIKKENALQPYEGGQNIPIPYMDMNLFLNRENETESALQLKIQQLKEAKNLLENLQKETDEAVLKMLEKYFFKTTTTKMILNYSISRNYSWSKELIIMYYDSIKDFLFSNLELLRKAITFDINMSEYDKNWKWYGSLLASKGNLYAFELSFLDYYINNSNEYNTTTGKYETKNAWFRVFESNAFWDIELINKYQFKHPYAFFYLSGNYKIDWSIELLEYYKDKWDYNQLSLNIALPWSEDLVSWFKNNPQSNPIYTELNWDSAFQKMQYGGEFYWKRKSISKDTDWNINEIEKNINLLDWSYFSANRSILFTLELFEKFENYWEWNNLSNNPSFYSRVLEPVLNDNVVEKLYKLHFS